MTGEVLEHTFLAPALALKCIIAEWREQHGLPPQQPAIGGRGNANRGGRGGRGGGRGLL